MKNVLSLSLIEVAFTVLCMIFSPGETDCAEKRIVGDWLGTLKVSGMELRLVFHISSDEEGGLKATLDSPDQGAEGIPVSNVEFEADSVKIEVGVVKGLYLGKMLPDSLAIEGEWSQSGFTIPLKLEIMGEEISIERYQDPKRPLPYREEEVNIDNAEAGVTLAGTLTLPGTPGPFPAAVLISGSGPQNRDELIMGHRPFLVLSDHLTRNGIAVLRYDDRGVGGSSGDHGEATTEDFASDARAALEFLMSRTDIDRSVIGMIGHSEGGIIAPMVAADDDDVAFIVMLAGTGLKGSRILLDQNRMIMLEKGLPEDLVERILAQLKDEYEVLSRHGDDDKIREEILEISSGHLENFSAREREEHGLDEDKIRKRIDIYLTSWMRFFMEYDPAPALSRLRCPVLVLMGGKDIQVGTEANLNAIRDALGAGDRCDFDVIEMPQLNHLFQTAGTGATEEYGRIEETMSPAVLDTITSWIMRRTTKR
jgi:pimeloyl-ACP methyl ester carboxylesterase